MVVHGPMHRHIRGRVHGTTGTCIHNQVCHLSMGTEIRNHDSIIFIIHSNHCIPHSLRPCISASIVTGVTSTNDGPQQA